ncbi:DUF4349 domain-containing protein [Acaryochloris marina]|uniref:DUF4349 domain-containing protein n=1 Tax=Acaryochloris marina (strain MBIC 11017) TaxID=329726 RepID=B0C5Q6_ACAM1|nr:DUF4349 domain-containing protein [Acaryochloris marina]ABW28777.1 conserved hypothetical protein [Acaryochloris marina MBIC11017]
MTVEHKRFTAPLWGTVVGAVLLASCSTPMTETVSESGEAPQAAQSELADLSNNVSAPADAAPPKAEPQLIKRANMTLRVEKVAPALKAVAKIVKTQQGDVVGLQDQVPPDESVRHQASMELRIPQTKLEATLEQLAQIGKVQNRSIEAEDVSTQLVDFQARLKNLRKSEEVVLKIMDRSGSVADVLKVSQELKTIRQQIEQIDAQVKRLQAQVAYSTVNLSLESAIATTPPQASLGERLQEAWSQSTHAVVNLTFGILGFLVWVVVFLPYILGLVLVQFVVKRLIQRRSNGTVTAANNESISG